MYRTSDLYLAAYLKTNDFKIEKTTKEQAKVFFYFDNSELIKDKVLEFFNDGTVRVNKFKNAINDLKTLIYNTGV